MLQQKTALPRGDGHGGRWARAGQLLLLVAAGVKVGRHDGDRVNNASGCKMATGSMTVLTSLVGCHEIRSDLMIVVVD